MKRYKILALVLALISICAFTLSGCKPPPPPITTATVENTNLGLVRTTDTVKNPTNDVSIEVYSKGKIAKSAEEELVYDKAFIADSPSTSFAKSAFANSGQSTPDTGHTVNPGDIITIRADYQYIKLEMLDLPETIIYSPTGEYVFQVPAAQGSTAWQSPNWQVPYPANVFSRNSNTIKASIPTAAEIAASRNLAVNPYDFLYANELNVTTETDKAPNDSLPDSSVSVENGEVLAFPHAYANRFTTGNNRGSFLPRNAIDGDLRTGKGHINYGYQSWGGGRAPTTNTSSVSTSNGAAWTAENNYGYYDDLTFVLYFGREVTLTEIGVVIRADDSGTVKHDINFSGMIVEFSDGTEQVVSGLVFSEEEQKVSLPAPKKTSSVRLKGFERNFDTSLTEEQAKTLGNWTALTELTAYGTDANTNSPAIKTTVKNTFGGKEIQYKTNAFSAADVGEIVDIAGKDAMEVVRTRLSQSGENNYVTVPTNLWVDSVLYSGLLDAYTTTGTEDHYIFTRYASDKYKYTLRRNEGGRGNRGAEIKNVVSDATYTGIGEVTDFADDYLMAESYLLMNDINPADHKAYNAYVNADVNMLHKPTWDANFNEGNWSAGFGQHARPSTLSEADVFDWWWCDSIYMGLNYFTYMSNATGDPQYIEKGFRSYEYWKDVLACNDNHTVNSVGHGSAEHGGSWALWHRDTDDTNIRINESTLALPTFWARGNAWVYAALAKQMMYIDQNAYPEIYHAYKEDFIAMSKTLKHYQREDGTWNVSIIDPSHYAGRETTGTSGFLYGMAIGVQLGILSANEYMPSIEKGFTELTENMRLYNVTDSRQTTFYGADGVPDGRLGYMQSVGYRAHNYGNENTVMLRANPFGYGLFLHAASAIMRMCSDYQPAECYVPADAQYGVAQVPEYNGVKL